MDNKINSKKTAEYAVFANMEEYMPVIKEQLSSGNSVEFAPTGTSMLPLIKEGRDSVILSPVQRVLKKYDIPLYRRENGKYILHRVVGFSDGCYIMSGDNQDSYERGITHDSVVAVATAIRRNGKLILLKGCKYRLYSIFVHRRRQIRNILKRALRWLKRRLSVK